MSRLTLYRSMRCVEGRLLRHDPQPDDPYLETDVGECPDCGGEGCKECDCCGLIKPGVSFCVAYGIDTYACDDCRGIT